MGKTDTIDLFPGEMRRKARLLTHYIERVIEITEDMRALIDSQRPRPTLFGDGSDRDVRMEGAKCQLNVICAEARIAKAGVARTYRIGGEDHGGNNDETS